MSTFIEQKRLFGSVAHRKQDKVAGSMFVWRIGFVQTSVESHRNNGLLKIAHADGVLVALTLELPLLDGQESRAGGHARIAIRMAAHLPLQSNITEVSLTLAGKGFTFTVFTGSQTAELY